MRPVIKSVEELYDRREATGEVILDEMAECLRKTRIIAVADLAALMDVDVHQLNQAVRLLTGMTTRDFINRWRLLQAREMLRQGEEGEAKDGFGQNAKDSEHGGQSATETERSRRSATETERSRRSGTKAERVKRLDRVARTCGWRSYRVLQKVARRYGVKLEIL